MPQYMLGHLDRLANIEHLLAPFPGLMLSGAAYGGVGIPDCIRQGQEAAEQAWKRLFQNSCQARS